MTCQTIRGVQTKNRELLNVNVHICDVCIRIFCCVYMWLTYGSFGVTPNHFYLFHICLLIPTQLFIVQDQGNAHTSTSVHFSPVVRIPGTFAAISVVEMVRESLPLGTRNNGHRLAGFTGESCVRASDGEEPAMKWSFLVCRIFLS